MRRICILAFLVISYTALSQVLPDQSMLKSHAPPSFRAVFKTTKGDFTIEATRAWSPEAVDRLWQLLATGFYNGNSIFRVQKGYVVQFGISDSKEVNYFWDKRPVYDEPVTGSNLKGTLSYARDGMTTRTAQLFINLKDNYKLDTVNFNGLRGFPPVAKILSGYETVEALYGGYGFEPAKFQDSVMVYGNKWMKEHYPLLDYIIEARLLPE